MVVKVTMVIDEEARLAGLKRLSILDTLPEQGYDDVVLLAAFICGTPISLVSFVDEQRQWFKAVHGLEVKQTHRSESFCSHAVEERKTLIVEDAQADSRFQSNPLVTGDPKIRFYAGAPIIYRGEILGTVCVIDTVPHSLSPEQVSSLEALARQVTSLLEHRHALAEAKQEAERLAEARRNLDLSEARFSLAAEAAGIAYWYFDPTLNLVGGDERMGRLFGLNVTEGPAELWLAVIHADDRERVRQEFINGIAGCDYDTEYRVVTRDAVHWIRAKARRLGDDPQRRMVGICEDVTARKLMEANLQTTAERLQVAQAAGRVATWEWNLESGSLLWGEESHWAYGRPPCELDTIAKVTRFLFPEDLPRVMESIQPAVTGTGQYSAEFRIIWPDGSIHWTQAFGKPTFDAFGRPLTVVGFNFDISERKAAEAALIRAEKLTAVGSLASSIAHEINNPLEAVTNLIYLSKTSTSLQEALPFLATADIELRRASAVASRALRFHRQQSKAMPVTFEDLLQGVFVGHHSRLANSSIKVDIRNRSVTTVTCYEGEIRQVLSNLVGNAIDAMQGKGGVLHLRAQDGRDWRSGRPGMVITVADDGIGMSTPTKSKMFEAFYTTKGIGGTGLGLWLSREIIERHVGRITVRSRTEPSRAGSVFTLFLPSDQAV